MEILLVIGFIVIAILIVKKTRNKGSSIPAVPPKEYPRPFPGGNKDNDETQP